MKITLFWNLDNPKYSGQEIKEALLKLGHKVEAVNDKEFEMKDLIDKANQSDLFLFHHGGTSTQTEYEFHLSLTRIQTILDSIKCKKVLWFLDKIQGSGELFAEQIVPFVDKAFFNDDTWVRRNKFDNVKCLHAGCEIRELGKEIKELKTDIVFVGSVYGTREVVFENLRQEYGRRFKVFQQAWEKDFDDLCQSVKIVLAPSYPSDDFYWSDRIYRTMAAGGFVLHPDLYGLKEEGFEKGVHYATYKNWNQMKEAIDYYSEHDEERIKIATAGREKVKEFTWKKRLQTLLSQS